MSLRGSQIEFPGNFSAAIPLANLLLALGIACALQFQLAALPIQVFICGCVSFALLWRSSPHAVLLVTPLALSFVFAITIAIAGGFVARLVMKTIGRLTPLLLPSDPDARSAGR